MSVASEPVRNLGAMFDSQLIMAPHVKSVVKNLAFTWEILEKRDVC